MRKFIAAHWRKIILIALGILLVGYLAIGFTIGYQVKRTIAYAQSHHPGEPVPALIALAVSESAPLKERNLAIWALGQLGAKEALPSLESLVTGKECDHDSEVCQHEVSKAIELCSGSLNLGALVWWRGDVGQ